MDTAVSLEIKEVLKREFIGFSPDLIAAIAEVGEIKSIPAGELMMDVGRYIKEVPLLFKGQVRIYRTDEEGNEIFLYYLMPGQACAISFVCSIRDRKSQIRATTETNCEFITFPIRYMDEWMLKHKSFYYYVLETFNMRFEEMLKVLDNVAFHRMDERLEDLLDKMAEAQNTKVLQVSHQEIAEALNSSREVISRLLKKMEKDGSISMGRGRIELLA